MHTHTTFSEAPTVDGFQPVNMWQHDWDGRGIIQGWATATVPTAVIDALNETPSPHLAELRKTYDRRVSGYSLLKVLLLAAFLAAFFAPASWFIPTTVLDTILGTLVLGILIIAAADVYTSRPGELHNDEINKREASIRHLTEEWRPCILPGSDQVVKQVFELTTNAQRTIRITHWDDAPDLHAQLPPISALAGEVLTNRHKELTTTDPHEVLANTNPADDDPALAAYRAQIMATPTFDEAVASGLDQLTAAHKRVKELSRSARARNALRHRSEVTDA